MKALALGDDEALRELFGRYERAVYGFVARRTGGRDVEDLCQETWIRVVRSAGRFDPARRFSTWLFQIAVNLCRDRARRTTVVGPPGAAPSDAETAGGARALDEAIDARTLLQALPEPHRNVVLLRHYHGFTEAEAAEILGCPPGTVKSRLHYAIGRLKELVKGEKR